MSILAGALLILGTISAVLWREAAAVRAHNQELVARVATLESARSGRSALPVARPGGLAPLTDAQDAAPAAVRAADDPAMRTAQQLAAGVRQAMDTPEGREFTRTMTRLSLQQRYPDLAKEMGISQEQADQLFELLSRRTIDLGMEAMDLRASLAPDGATGEQLARLLAERQQAYEQELSSLLGSNYPKWKEYERTSAVRQQERAVQQRREQLRNAISSRNSPLGQAQFDAFAAAVDAEQKRIDQESRPQRMERGPQRFEQQMQRLTENNRRLLEVAALHLDTTQLERYRRHLEQQAQMMRSIEGAFGAAAPGQ